MSSPVSAPVPPSTLPAAESACAPASTPASTCAPAVPAVRPSAMELWQRWQRPRRWPAWALLAWCIALFFFGIAGTELWRTESLRAIIAQEMLESGNWIVPTLYGEPLFTKPPGMYAAIALLSAPFGQVLEWTARLPSALAATCTVFLFYWHFKRRLGQRAGLIAALILPMGPMWLDKASAAEIDMVQVAWVAGALLFLFRALEEHDRQAPPRVLWCWWLAALLCTAGGVLTKWTAPAFFYATAVTLLWRRGQLRLLLSRYHIVSAAVAGALCATWIVAAIVLEGWDVFYATVTREALSRIVPTYRGNPYRWWEVPLHPFVIGLATLPLSAVALLALRPGFARRWDEPGRRTLQELHCWIWPNIIVWSLMTEHTPRHSFPLFAGIAGLAALVWIGWFSGRLSWPLRGVSPMRCFAAALAVWLCIKTLFVFAIMPARNASREPRAKGALLARLVPAGEVLYLFRLKDEGIMFYYGRPVLRLASPRDLPASATPIYCILTRAEWSRWTLDRPAEVIQEFLDEQGDPCILIRVS